MNRKVTHQPLPSYHFEGQIVVPPGKGYVQDYVDLPFDVPEGAGAVRLHLQYAPLEKGGVNNLITLGLFDPQGPRGTAHRSPPDGQVILSPVLTTPGFLSRPVLPGRWLAQLAVQAVVPSQPPCAYSLDIDLLPATEGRRPRPAEKIAASSQPRPAQASWFRGELHSHTLHSDGSLAVPELIAEAQRYQLDFLAITDHNTASALEQVDPATLNGLLLIPGLELTTFNGHALALGVRDWVDWRTGYQGWTMEDAARRTREMGGLLIIAHPNAVGNPICTGCHWEDTDFDLNLVDAVEVWNGAWGNPDNSNPLSLDWWQRLQNESRRMPASCGADFHKIGNWGGEVPFSYIYAASLSTADILEGIRRGRMILSSGPRLSLRLSQDGDSQSAGIGDTLKLHTPSKRVHLELSWEYAPLGARLRVRSRQGVLIDEAIAETGSLQPGLDVLAKDSLWVELYSGEGALRALTNPVFTDGM